jgi:hypothetical protein
MLIDVISDVEVTVTFAINGCDFMPEKEKDSYFSAKRMMVDLADSILDH